MSQNGWFYLRTIRTSQRRHKQVRLIQLPEALTNPDISHEGLTAIINKAGKYQNLFENIRIKKSQRSDIEKHKLIKGSKNGN